MKKIMLPIRVRKVLGKIKPKDVFTPATSARINYIKRPGLIENLHHYFDTDGKQLVVFGYSGSGKTTLITNELYNKKIKYIITQCTQDITYEKLLYNAFDELNIYYEKTKTNKIDSLLSAEYSGVKTQINGSTVSTSERIIPYQINAEKLAKFLGKIECYWIIEDLHKLRDDERRKVADALKIFIDIANKYPKTKIICLGAFNSSKDLIELDPNLNNRVADINVPLLSNEEICSLIQNGFNLLNIYIPEEHLRQVIDLSNNIGSVAHQLCLNICHTLRVTQSSAWRKYNINDSIIQESIQNFVAEHSGRFKSLLDKILSNGKIGSRLLRKLSDSEIDGISSNAIYKELSSFPENVITDLLNKMCSLEYEEVLRYDDNAKKYKLMNPFFKVYVKMYFELNRRIRKSNKTNKRSSNNKLITVDLSSLITDEKQFDLYYQKLIESINKLKDLELDIKNKS